MDKEWPTIKRWEEKQRLQRQRDKALESVGTPDRPYVQQLSAKEREQAAKMLKAQGISEVEIAARFLEMDKAKAKQALEAELAKLQNMSKDELAIVITSPEFEQLPSALQDAYTKQMLD